jgi:hypothetical protein
MPRSGRGISGRSTRPSSLSWGWPLRHPHSTCRQSPRHSGTPLSGG